MPPATIFSLTTKRESCETLPQNLGIASGVGLKKGRQSSVNAMFFWFFRCHFFFSPVTFFFSPVAAAVVVPPAPIFYMTTKRESYETLPQNLGIASGTGLQKGRQSRVNATIFSSLVFTFFFLARRRGRFQACVSRKQNSKQPPHFLNCP